MNKRRWLFLLLVILLWIMLVLWILLIVDIAYAQETAQEATEPTGIDFGASIMQSFAKGMQLWFDDWMRRSGVSLVLKGLFGAIGLMAKGYLASLGNASRAGGYDIMTQLSPAGTIDDPTVQQIVGRTRDVFNGIVGAGIIAVGFLCLFNFGGVQGKEIGLLVPRLFIGTVLVNNSMTILRWLAEGANQIGVYLGGGSGDLSGTINRELSAEQSGATLVVLAGIMGLLALQRIVEHGILSALAITANLALAAWVIPMWAKWFGRWATLLGGLVLGATFQTLLMSAGSSMLSRAIAQSDEGSKAAVAGMFAGGVLLTAITAPALVGGVAVGGTLMGAASRFLRQQRNIKGEDKTPPEQATTPRATAEEVHRTTREEPIIIYDRLPPAPTPAAPALPPPVEYVDFKG